MTAINEFLHTNAISPPNDQWSYREADELMKAVEFIKPVRKDEIRQYVHHMLIRAVKRVAAIDLNELVKILLVANQHNFAQLKTMCYASICNYHYNTFKRRFNADAANDEDRAIFEQLQLSRAFTFQNPIEYIDRM
ncbi:BTB domain-containing protein [Aphelenchoides besseyi]|nr:BTB domain-containing protein [Aphelenchoides besseyi]KAI6209357.1 BTB domain-containing protein [Aphelenchoides besseyi]